MKDKLSDFEIDDSFKSMEPRVNLVTADAYDSEGEFEEREEKEEMAAAQAAAAEAHGNSGGDGRRANCGDGDHGRVELHDDLAASPEHVAVRRLARNSDGHAVSCSHASLGRTDGLSVWQAARVDENDRSGWVRVHEEA